MAPRNRAAFTLVELLVVITIIGMLVALLIPAVLSARNRARITQCASNQGQLGKAMINYEVAKRHFPGYANTLRNRPGNTDVRVSWAPLLLPYIERGDLWEDSAIGWRNGNKTAVANISTFVCPSDSAPDYGLSYVVNVGAILPDTSVSATLLGLFRDQSGTPNWVSMTDVKSTTRHPMISEKSATFYSTARIWSAFSTSGDGDVTATQFGFIWPNSNAMIVNSKADPYPVNPTNGMLVPIHPDVINVTFCDGHTETLNDAPETVYSLYEWANPS